MSSIGNTYQAAFDADLGILILIDRNSKDGASNGNNCRRSSH
jgi:hypothetical protein